MFLGLENMIWLYKMGNSLLRIESVEQINQGPLWTEFHNISIFESALDDNTYNTYYDGIQNLIEWYPITSLGSQTSSKERNVQGWKMVKGY